MVYEPQQSSNAMEVKIQGLQSELAYVVEQKDSLHFIINMLKGEVGRLN